MKPILTALGICALLLGPAMAFADTYTWDGGYGPDAYWNSAQNWVDDTAPTVDPTLPATDSINIDANNLSGASRTLSDHAYAAGGTAYWITVTVVSNGTDAMTLKKSGGQGFGTSGLVTIQSEQVGTAGANSATFWVTATPCTPYSMVFDGSTHATDGHAIADIDVNVTVGSSTTVKHYVDFNVEGGDIFTAGSMTMGDKTGGTGYYADFDLDGGGTVTASSIVIEGGPSNDSIVTVTSGTLQTN